MDWGVFNTAHPLSERNYRSFDFLVTQDGFSRGGFHVRCDAYIHMFCRRGLLASSLLAATDHWNCQLWTWVSFLFPSTQSLRETPSVISVDCGISVQGIYCTSVEREAHTRACVGRFHPMVIFIHCSICDYHWCGYRMNVSLPRGEAL